MNQKSLLLVSVGIFAVFLFAGLISAGVDFVNKTNDVSTVIQGNSVIVSFQAQEDGYGNLTNISFNTPLTLTYGAYSFNSEANIVGAITSLDQDVVSDAMSLTFNIPSTQHVGTYTGNLTLAGNYLTERTYDLPITITVEAAEPDWTNNFCIYDDGVSSNPGDLRVRIKDIKVEGFGDDTEWLPFDEIEVEVEVENKGNEDVDDIYIEWGLYDEYNDDWVIEVDDEPDFSLKDGDEEVLTFTFTIDDGMDIDLEDLEDGKHYVLYVRATGDVDNDDNDETCERDSEEIELIIERDFAVLSNFDYPETVSCGSDLTISAEVWNIGSRDQDDVSLKIYNKELDITEEVEVGNIDSFEKENFEILIKIPEDAKEKSYSFIFEVIDEDGDIFESDYEDELARFSVPVTVEGSCGEVPTGISAVVSAVLESGGKAGEPLVVKATITNTGTSTATFTLNAVDYTEWADTADIDPSRYTLDKGESGEITITFNVKKNIEGDKLFKIEVISENELVVEQPVSVTIEKASVGTDIFGENWYLWLIGILNVILVIVIIIVAIRVAKR